MIQAVDGDAARAISVDGNGVMIGTDFDDRCSLESREPLSAHIEPLSSFADRSCACVHALSDMIAN